MQMTGEETLSVQIQRLRAMLTQLEFAPAGERHDELLDRVRVATAAVRSARAALDANSCRVDASAPLVRQRTAEA